MRVESERTIPPGPTSSEPAHGDVRPEIAAAFGAVLAQVTASTEDPGDTAALEPRSIQGRPDRLEPTSAIEAHGAAEVPAAEGTTEPSELLGTDAVPADTTRGVDPDDPMLPAAPLDATTAVLIAESGGAGAPGVSRFGQASPGIAAPASGDPSTPGLPTSQGGAASTAAVATPLVDLGDASTPAAGVGDPGQGAPSVAASTKLLEQMHEQPAALIDGVEHGPISTTSTTPKAPTAASATTVSAPSSPPATYDGSPTQQLVSVLAPLRLRKDGNANLSLTLRPDDLGRVDVELRIDRGTMHLALRTEQASTAELLRTALQDLRNQLHDHGIATGDVTVGEHAQRDTSHRERTPVVDHGVDDEVPVALIDPLAINPDALVDVRM